MTDVGSVDGSSAVHGNVPVSHRPVGDTADVSSAQVVGLVDDASSGGYQSVLQKTPLEKVLVMLSGLSSVPGGGDLISQEAELSRLYDMIVENTLRANSFSGFTRFSELSGSYDRLLRFLKDQVDARTEMKRLNEQHRRLESQLSTATSDLDASSSEVKVAGDRVSSIQLEYDAAIAPGSGVSQGRVDVLKGRLDLAKQQLSEAETRFGAKQSVVAKLTDDLTALRTAKNALSDKVHFFSFLSLRLFSTLGHVRSFGEAGLSMDRLDVVSKLLLLYHDASSHAKKDLPVKSDVFHTVQWTDLDRGEFTGVAYRKQLDLEQEQKKARLTEDDERAWRLEELVGVALSSGESNDSKPARLLSELGNDETLSSEKYEALVGALVLSVVDLLSVVSDEREKVDHDSAGSLRPGGHKRLHVRG